MNYYIVEPEVAGGLGQGTLMNSQNHPPDVKILNYEFDGWLGDVLLESFPCFIITVDAMEKIRKISATGAEFADVSVTKSSQFNEVTTKLNLPEFTWLKVFGIAGADDWGLAADFRLVVSSRVLDVLKQLGFSHALIEDF